MLKKLTRFFTSRLFVVLVLNLGLPLGEDLSDVAALSQLSQHVGQHGVGILEVDVGGRQSLSGIHSLYVSVGVAALFLLDSGAVLEDFRHDGGAGAHLALAVPVEDVNDIGAGHEVQEVTHGFHLLIGAGVEHDQLMSDQVTMTGSVSTGDGHSLRSYLKL